MALTTIQQQIKDYFTIGSAGPKPWMRINSGEIKPLSEWFALGDAEDILSALNDTPLGRSLGLRAAQRGIVSNTTFKVRMASDPTLLPNSAAQSALNWIVNGGDLNFGNAELISAIQLTLLPYESLLETFNTLLTRPASINDSLFNGAATSDDVNAALAG